MDPDVMDGERQVTRRVARRTLRLAGIELRVHWTFVLLLVWILASHLLAGHGARLALEGVGFIVAIFACVVLHELGHALVARRFGIRTRDITLYPIGGVARLERIPERPAEELWVAVAGPAVNLAIAAILFAVVGGVDGVPSPASLQFVGGSVLWKLMLVNIAIALFNLIPAFPMDGGRVLRALLAMRMDYVRATQLAATAGQAIAILLGVLGLFTNWFLLFVALFVFIAAQKEAHAVQVRAALAGVPVRAAMITRFEALEASDPLSRAVAVLVEGDQQDFPIFDTGKLVGVLPRSTLLRALATSPRDSAVGEAMISNIEPVDEKEMLDAAISRMQSEDCSTLPVVAGGKLVGLVTIENVGEWMMVQAATRPK